MNIPNELIDKQCINIVVIGAGGTGGYLMSFLAQANYSLNKISNGDRYFSITLFDGDDVSETNIGRQNFYPCDIGSNKAQVVTHRLNCAFGTRWQYSACDFDLSVKEHATTLCNADVLFTCVDTAKFRYELGQEMENEELELIWIDGGCANSEGQVICGNTYSMQEDFIPSIFHLYGEGMLSEVEDNTPSCSHTESLRKQDYGINHLTALYMQNMLWQLLRHGKLAHQALYYSLTTGHTHALEPKSETWKTFQNFTQTFSTSH